MRPLASHVIGVADEGDSLRVAVTATNADGTATAVSGATAAIPSCASEQYDGADRHRHRPAELHR